MRTRNSTANRLRRITAVAIASTFLSHNFAWAVCSDGSTLPAEGFVIGLPPVVNADNWSPDVFTGTTGSIWVPDTSVYENNDPSKPLTGGGHNWVFDQGSTLCKVTDEGPAGSLPTGWSIPPNNPTDCVILPVIVQGRVTNFGDIPYQGDAITPTCDPTQYVNGDPITGPAQPTNTYFNHLGCSISHGVATTPQTATTYLFVAGIKGGLFSIPLDNADNSVVGGEAGKGVTGQNYYSQIPSGSFLTNAAVSKDGQFAIATSIRRDLRVWGCFNPLGDPGDPSLAINPDFFLPPGSEVPCMEVGSNNLAVDLTTAFGPDNQPYFGGRRVVNSFNSVPGSNDVNNPVSTAWPNCIWQNNGAASLADAFNNNFQNGCGSAQPNFTMLAALITQPSALISHGKYMYTGPIGGTIYQFLVKVNPLSGLSQYKFRTYVSGLSILTGLGVDDALQSLFVYTDPTAIGLAAREFVTKLPLCEDMDGEVPTPVATAPGGAVPGGTAPGGAVPGGTVPGGTVAGGTVPGGTVAGGTVPGGTVAGGTVAGGTVAGGTTTAILAGAGGPVVAVPGATTTVGTTTAIGAVTTTAGATTTPIGAATPTAGAAAATGVGATTTGGLIIGGGAPATGAPATGAATTAGAIPTTGAAATTTGAFTVPRAGAATGAGTTTTGASTIIGAGITTPPLSTGTTTGAGNTTTGTGIVAIGGSTTGIPASGIITGPTFTVKVVPNGGG
jgi:hypothetical protein